MLCGTGRRGWAAFELLLTACTVLLFVGLLRPIVRRALHADQRERLAIRLSSIQKHVVQRESDDGLWEPYYRDVPGCFPKVLRREFELQLEALVPEVLPEVPVDPWGQPVYRYGNFLTSRGPDGLAGNEDDVTVRIRPPPAARDPETGTVYMDPVESEAFFQAEYIAGHVKDFVRSTGEQPASLEEVFFEQGRGVALDPWSNPYQLLTSPARLVSSLGADGEPATADDVAVAWDETDHYGDDFVAGFRGWVKVFPAGLRPPSMPLDWLPGKVRLAPPPGSIGAMTAWVKPPPPGTETGPYARVSCRFSAERRRGEATLGLILNYRGPGTGYRGTLTLGPIEGDATLTLVAGVPGPKASWTASPMAVAFAGIEVQDDAWKDLELSLELLRGTPPRVSLRVLGGPHQGELTVPVTDREEAGAGGFFVIAPGIESGLVVEVHGLAVSGG